jgi:hypothetical protein
VAFQGLGKVIYGGNVNKIFMLVSKLTGTKAMV